MSYILDALRKSEAARRSREAPDLLAETAAPPTPAPSARAPKSALRPAWALAGFGLLALAVALWLRIGDQDTQTANDAADTSAVASVNDAHPEPFAVSDAAPASPLPAAAGPQASSTNTTPSPAPIRSGAATVDSAAQPPAPSLPASGPSTSPVAAAARDVPPSIAPPRPPVESPSRPDPEDEGTRTASTAALPAASGGRPVMLADIAPDLRRQMPPLKLSMHLWNPQPERRLLVLDGQRLRQGDVIGEVVVERIDRDGVILSWRGARVALPVE